MAFRDGHDRTVVWSFFFFMVIWFQPKTYIGNKYIRSNKQSHDHRREHLWDEEWCPFKFEISNGKFNRGH